MKELKNGLLTGLTLQLAIGPVFFYIVNLALQKTVVDGFAGVLAVTLVDYIYITLAIVGIGKVLENKKVKKIFGGMSSVVLVIFGILILKNVIIGTVSSVVSVGATNVLSSFLSVFFLTITSPLTIVLFTSLFASKAIELGYTKKQLLLFGMGTGSATFLFMGTSVLLFSLIRESVPIILIQVLNGTVGSLLIGYGTVRLIAVVKDAKTN